MLIKNGFSGRLGRYNQLVDSTTKSRDLLANYMIGALSTIVSDEDWDSCLEGARDFFLQKVEVKTYPVNVGPNSCKDTDVEVEEK